MTGNNKISAGYVFKMELKLFPVDMSQMDLSLEKLTTLEMQYIPSCSTGIGIVSMSSS